MTLAIPRRVNRVRWLDFLVVSLAGLWVLFMIFFLVAAGSFSLMSLPGSTPPFVFLLVPVVLGLLTAVGSRKRWAMALPLVGFLLGTTQLDVNWKPLPVSVADADAKELAVFNWNSLMWDEKKDKAAFYQFLQKQNADIYLLQEVLYSASEHDVESDARLNRPAIPISTVIPGLDADYLTFDKTPEILSYFPGYHLVHQQQFLILSRYPIHNAYLDPSDQFQVADVQIGEHALRLFNVHIALHIEFKDPLTRDFYEALDRRFRVRDIAFDRLHTAIKKTQQDYIIAGDFNSPKPMGTMRTLTKQQVDLFRYGQERLPVTFEFNGLRWWRFDYVFANPDHRFQVLGFENIPIEALSDHNAQKITLQYLTEDS